MQLQRLTDTLRLCEIFLWLKLPDLRTGPVSVTWAESSRFEAAGLPQ